MAKRRVSRPVVVEKDYLSKPKTKFKSELDERIEKGNEMLNRQISDTKEWGKLKNDYNYWNDYNAELIKQAFEKPNNSYYKEYTYVGIRMSTIGGSYHQPSLNELVNNVRGDVNKHLTRITKIREKVDLFEELPGVQYEEEVDMTEIAFQFLDKVFSKFHKAAQSLRSRHANRDTLTIRDEYDVQDLLRSFLKIGFDDVREEDYSPSYAGSNSRVDFVLKDEKIVIEVKITSDSLKDKELGNQLLIDIGRYKCHPDCRTLVVFVYDKEDQVVNKVGLINDLEKMSTSGMEVKVYINPN